MNYFEFFGLPLSFVLDETALKKVYLQNSKKYHPDFHTLADETRQAAMLEQSTLNNEAYKTLSNPDLRIRYVLEIKGLLAAEGEDKPVLAQDFLMDMMDINEALMELEFDFDPIRYTSTLQAVQSLETELDAAVKPLLENWSEMGSSGDVLTEIRNFFWKKKYLLRISENLSKFAPAFESKGKYDPNDHL